MMLLWLVLLAAAACASRDAKRLHDDLLSDYNRLIRPVGNHSHKVTIVVGLKLSQLIDIVSVPRRPPSLARYGPHVTTLTFVQNLKHQVMTTNIWLEQVSCLLFTIVVKAKWCTSNPASSEYGNSEHWF